MATQKPRQIEYICSYCGRKEVRPATTGKPALGKCPRKQGDKPHTWTVNKKM